MSVHLHLHIERVVLDGIDLDPADRPALQAALAAELGRCLAQAGGLGPALAAGGAQPALRAPGFQLAPATGPARLGRQIARAVHGGLAR
jgi:hypothetical protein